MNLTLALFLVASVSAVLAAPAVDSVDSEPSIEMAARGGKRTFDHKQTCDVL